MDEQQRTHDRMGAAGHLHAHDDAPAHPHDDHDRGHDHHHHHDHGDAEAHDAHNGITRRDLLKGLTVTAGAAASLPFLSAESASALEQMRSRGVASKFAFFTRAQHATVDALAERLIPADDHSPGARAARVADFIDLLVSESPAAVKTVWTDGLAALDKASQDQFHAPFVKISEAEQVSLLTEISKNELDAKTPLELFFRESKARTVQGYYTSKIGIHQELGYKGNQFLQEFVGYEQQS